MRRARAIITGRVQGVSYRASTVAEARRLGGLTGWVRNLADDSVELEVEGEDERVAALLAWCAAGPPSARVDGVEVSEQTATGADRDFAQRR